MNTDLCEFCLNQVREPFEIILYFERKCRAIVDSARLGCRLCAMIQADLHLLGSEKVAKVYCTPVEAFLNPKNDGWGLVMGMNRTPLRYLMQNPEDIDPLIVESGRTIGDTRSKASFNQARSWLKSCIHEHDHCASIDSHFRPTRLLRLGKCGELVSLCSGSSLPPGTQYATLSHCWGGTVSGQPKTSNIRALESSVPQEFLGNTFRDAAEVALELGLCFIWIDSLCIIQDSPEDWQSESVKMSDVYGNSACNIAATSASNTFGGCFSSQNLDDLKPVKLKFGETFNGGDDFYLTNATQWWSRFQREPLNRRAWIVQERLLSRRNIHYTQGQLVWECNDLLACEVFPRGFGDLLSRQTRPVRVPLDAALRNAQEEEVPGQALAQIWRPVVNAFTVTGITKPTDRLIALYGVGSRIQQVCGWPYVAGMFLKNLQSQLCWTVTGGVKSTRPKIPIAPTWSWASVSSPIHMMPQWDMVERDETSEGPTAEDLNEHYLCSVLGIEPGTSAAENSGHASSAVLRVSGHLVPARILRPQDAEWCRPKVHANKISEWFHCISWRIRYFFNDLLKRYEILRLKYEGYEIDMKSAMERTAKPLRLRFNSVQDKECDILSQRDEEESTFDQSSWISADVQVNITWDDCNGDKPHKARNLMFMPVYQLRDYGNWQPSIGFAPREAMHGLILQATDRMSGQCMFRRCGTFTVRAEGMEDSEDSDISENPEDGGPAVLGLHRFWMEILRSKVQAQSEGIGLFVPSDGVYTPWGEDENDLGLTTMDGVPQSEIRIF